MTDTAQKRRHFGSPMPAMTAARAATPACAAHAAAPPLDQSQPPI